MPDLKVEHDVLAQVRVALRTAGRDTGRLATDAGCLGSATVEAAYTQVLDVLDWAADALRTSAVDAAAGVVAASHDLTQADRTLAGAAG